MCLIGHPVDVVTRSGAVYSGIFHTANTESGFGVVLRMARLTKDGSAAKGSSTAGRTEVLREAARQPPIKTLVVHAKDFVQIIAKDVPLEREVLPNGRLRDAVGSGSNGGGRGELATDLGISGRRASVAERELKPWRPDVGDEAGHHRSLPLEQTPWNGRSWDQFEANRALFGVETSFDESLYTTKLERGPPGREREAARIAREIESQATRNNHLAEERGLRLAPGVEELDEETRYSSVVRSRKMLVHSEDADKGANDEEDRGIDDRNDETFGPAAGEASSPGPPPSRNSSAVLELATPGSPPETVATVGGYAAAASTGPATPPTPEAVEGGLLSTDSAGQVRGLRRLRYVGVIVVLHIVASAPSLRVDLRRLGSWLQPHSPANGVHGAASPAIIGGGGSDRRAAPAAQLGGMTAAMLDAADFHKEHLRLRLNPGDRAQNKRAIVKAAGGGGGSPYHSPVGRRSPLMSPMLGEPASIQALNLDPSCPQLAEEVVREFHEFKLQETKKKDKKQREEVVDGLKSFSESLKDRTLGRGSQPGSPAAPKTTSEALSRPSSSPELKHDTKTELKPAAAAVPAAASKASLAAAKNAATASSPAAAAATPSAASLPAPSDASSANPATTGAGASSPAKLSTLNPHAKEFKLNPNAKAFMPSPATAVGSGRSSSAAAAPPQFQQGQQQARPAAPGAAVAGPSPVFLPGGGGGPVGLAPGQGGGGGGGMPFLAPQPYLQSQAVAAAGGPGVPFGGQYPASMAAMVGSFSQPPPPGAGGFSLHGNANATQQPGMKLPQHSQQQMVAPMYAQPTGGIRMPLINQGQAQGPLPYVYPNGQQVHYPHQLMYNQQGQMVMVPLAAQQQLMPIPLQQPPGPPPPPQQPPPQQQGQHSGKHRGGGVLQGAIQFGGPPFGHGGSGQMFHHAVPQGGGPHGPGLERSNSSSSNRGGSMKS
eukprot:SM000027S09602  [mRNA]  locus=s27:276426:281254:- [translate_table: standard]